MSTQCFRFSFPDDKHSILAFDVTVEAENGEQAVAKLVKYLRHQMTLAQLVDWAEDAVMDGEFAEDGLPALRDVVARLGVADVRAFGLTWEDCRQLLGRLGFTAHVDIVAHEVS